MSVNVLYREGDIFAVPLRTSGFALGVVARMPKERKVLLGYFFGYRFDQVPDAKDIPTLNPSDAIKVYRFGDLHLIDRKWPIISHIENWQRDNWPTPKFIRQDDLSKRAWLVSYSDENPSVVLEEEPCDFGMSGYERAALLGAGAVEIAHTKLISN
jgi:hypothetical protein